MVTMVDVADRAGVSLGTVSRYLNGYNLREYNQKKVKEAIRELDFNPNIMGKALRQKQSLTLGVLLYDWTDIFGMSITKAFGEVVEQSHYSLIMCHAEGDLKRRRQKIQFLRDRCVDGLVVFPILWEGCEDLLQKFLDERIPVVMMDGWFEGLTTDRVSVENASASLRAVEMLIHANHKKIAVINGSRTETVAQERLSGYREALRLYRIPVREDLVTYGNYNCAEAYQITKELLSLPDPPTALFVANYYMTLGAIMALNEMNVRIPDDLSLIGFDHFELSDVIKPPLTVIEQPVEEMGQAAAALILRRIHGDYQNFPQERRINTRMLIRDSVRVL